VRGWRGERLAGRFRKESAMRWVYGLAAAAILVALPAWAADSFPDTEYVSGKAGFTQKIKGTLTVDDTMVKFQDKDGREVFSLPMASVVKASNSKEHDEGSFGRKMALGIFASKTEEFLQIDTKSDNGAEAVVFKTKKKMSPGMAAKINFYAEKHAAAAK
jgi:hypothetical protein